MLFGNRAAGFGKTAKAQIHGNTGSRAIWSAGITELFGSGKYLNSAFFPNISLGKTSIPLSISDPGQAPSGGISVKRRFNFGWIHPLPFEINFNRGDFPKTIKGPPNERKLVPGETSNRLSEAQWSSGGGLSPRKNPRPRVFLPFPAFNIQNPGIRLTREGKLTHGKIGSRGLAPNYKRGGPGNLRHDVEHAPEEAQTFRGRRHKEQVGAPGPPKKRPSSGHRRNHGF